MAKIAHLFRAPRRRMPMEELEHANAVANFGIEGCLHGRLGSKRQVLLMDRETLEALNLAPGIIRENLTTEGLDVNALQPGQRLKMGEVLLEVSAECDPCELMEAIRPGLREALAGKRGMLCRVLNGGTLARGDEITVER
jgi:MOSC domain-containing protein YiiM